MQCSLGFKFHVVMPDTEKARKPSIELASDALRTAGLVVAGRAETIRRIRIFRDFVLL